MIDAGVAKFERTRPKAEALIVVSSGALQPGLPTCAGRLAVSDRRRGQAVRYCRSLLADVAAGPGSTRPLTRGLQHQMRTRVVGSAWSHLDEGIGVLQVWPA